MVTITKADGSALGTAVYSSGTTYVWTNATGGSVALAKTDPIWLKVVDSTTLYPSYFYKVLVYTGETNWLAWRDQTMAITLIENTIVKVRVQNAYGDDLATLDPSQTRFVVTLNGAVATIDSNYHVFFNSSTISIASGSTNLILKDGTLAAYTTKTLTVPTGNIINTIASPVIFAEATTSI